MKIATFLRGRVMASFQGPRIKPPTSTIRLLSTQQEISEANERCKTSVQIRATDDGRGYGIFAVRDFEPGECVIESIALDSLDATHSHTIQTGWKTHVYMNLPARFLNHMCDPNLKVKPNDFESYDFVAWTKIDKGSEVGFDYETVEYENYQPIECGCGSPKCRKVLKGYRFSKDAILKSHGQDVIAPYLLCNDTD